MLPRMPGYRETFCLQPSPLRKEAQSVTVTVSEIFSNQIADCIQFVSFALESLGFALAFVGLYRQPLAERIEGHIDQFCSEQVREVVRLGERMSEVRLAFSNYLSTEEVSDRLIGMAAFLSLAGPGWAALGVESFKREWPVLILAYIATFIGLAAVAMCLTGIIYALHLLFVRIGLAVLRFLPLILLFPVAVIVHSVFRKFDQLGRGNAIGAIGIAIASLGLVGEVYQIVTILVQLPADTISAWDFDRQRESARSVREIALSSHQLVSVCPDTTKKFWEIKHG